MSLELLIAIIIAIINLGFCFFALKWNLRIKTNLVLWWILAAYFGFIYIFKLFSFNNHIFGFNNFEKEISNISKLYNIIFWTFLNILFLLGQVLNKRFSKKEVNNNIFLYYYNWDNIAKLFIIILLLTLYPLYSRLSDIDYTNFVEYRGSAWDLIFFQVALPLSVIGFRTGRRDISYIIILIGASLSYLTSVRSLVLMPVLSIVVLLTDQILNNKNQIRESIKLVFVVFSIGALSIVISSFYRTGEIDFPESGLININMVVFQEFDLNANIGINSYISYGLGLIRPFLLGSIDFSKLPQSVSEYNASIFYGYSEENSLGNYYHMPALWYNEIIVSFGYWSIILAIAYGFFFSFLENKLKKNPVIYVLFLPAYVWNLYFVFRGAADNTLSSISYSFWILVIIYFFLKFFSKINNANTSSNK